MTYRQSGNDFWTGPLDENGDISAETCDNYDKHFSITRQEVMNSLLGSMTILHILIIQFLLVLLIGQEMVSMVTTSF